MPAAKLQYAENFSSSFGSLDQVESFLQVFGYEYRKLSHDKQQYVKSVAFKSFSTNEPPSTSMSHGIRQLDPSGPVSGVYPSSLHEDASRNSDRGEPSISGSSSHDNEIHGTQRRQRADREVKNCDQTTDRHQRCERQSPSADEQCPLLSQSGETRLKEPAELPDTPSLDRIQQCSDA
jgi:hypothetical protein